MLKSMHTKCVERSRLLHSLITEKNNNATTLAFSQQEKQKLIHNQRERDQKVLREMKQTPVVHVSCQSVFFCFLLYFLVFYRLLFSIVFIVLYCFLSFFIVFYCIFIVFYCFLLFFNCFLSFFIVSCCIFIVFYCFFHCFYRFLLFSVVFFWFLSFSVFFIVFLIVFYCIFLGFFVKDIGFITEYSVKCMHCLHLLKCLVQLSDF